MRTNEELALAIQNGDMEAAGELYEQVKFLGMKFIKPYMRLFTEVEFNNDDMMQELFMVMMDTVKKFDPSIARFSTLYVYMVKGRMEKVLYNSGLQVPYNHIRNFRKVCNAIDDFKLDNGRKPNKSEIMKMTGLTSSQVTAAMSGGRRKRIISLEYQGLMDEFDTVNNEKNFGSMFSDPKSEEEFENINDEIDRDILLNKLQEVLTKRQYEIVTLVFGFGCEPHSYTDAGKILGCSKENVHQTIQKAKKRMLSNAEIAALLWA